jgi:hypothetical protein
LARLFLGGLLPVSGTRQNQKLASFFKEDSNNLNGKLAGSGFSARDLT